MEGDIRISGGKKQKNMLVISAFVIVLVIGTLMWGMPNYNVYAKLQRLCKRIKW